MSARATILGSVDKVWCEDAIGTGAGAGAEIGLIVDGVVARVSADGCAEGTSEEDGDGAMAVATIGA